MLKIRYFAIRLPVAFDQVLTFVQANSSAEWKNGLRLVQYSVTDIVLAYTVERVLPIRRYLENGDEVIENAVTMDRHSVRLFKTSDKSYLSLLDPGRSTRIVVDILDAVFPDGGYFIDPVEVSSSLIHRHIEKFDSFKLVSAKIKDFEVYRGAVGRLEISSQEGLAADIAPFLQDKFYRVDSFTYEVTHNFVKGSIQYTRNGTVRISGPLIESAFPMFESCL